MGGNVVEKLLRAKPRIDPPPPHRTLTFGKREERSAD
jgi:hypothetical protein